MGDQTLQASSTEREALAGLLLRLAAGGEIPGKEALQAATALAPRPEGPDSRSRALDLLGRTGGDEGAPLRAALLRSLIRDAQEWHRARATGAIVGDTLRRSLAALPIDPAPPLGWRTVEASSGAIEGALAALDAWRLVEARKDLAPRLAVALADRCAREVQEIHASGGGAMALDPTALLLRLTAEDGPGGALSSEERESLRDRGEEVLKSTLRSYVEGVAVLPTATTTPVAGEEGVLRALCECLAAEPDHARRTRLLDAILTWPTDACAAAILAACASTWARDRAVLVLTMRHGARGEWREWSRRLEEVVRERARLQAPLEELAARRPAELLALLCLSPASGALDLLPSIERCCRTPTDGAALSALARRFGDLADPAEVAALRASFEAEGVRFEEATAPAAAPATPESVPPPATGAPELLAPKTPAVPEVPPPTPVIVTAVAPPPASSSLSASLVAPVARAPLAPRAPRAVRIELVAPPPERARASSPRRERPEARTPPPPPPPVEPPLWRSHLEGFVAQNWTLLIGLLMVLAGSSLLAYFTWDKHWLFRYTLAPLLLGGFTGALARLGGWLESKDAKLAATAALLRAAAIGLLPVNFMAVALLASDPDVPAKGLAVPLMAAIYLGLGWLGLARWCGAVHPALRGGLAPVVLAVNSLVLLAPLAGSLSLGPGGTLLAVAVGFHLGFLGLTWATYRFATGTLDRTMALERRVPAFFGAALLVSFVEVFLWTYGLLRHVPAPETYALLLVLAGAVVLFIERRFLELLEAPDAHGEASFLGFALPLLGILLAIGEPWTRTACLLASGALWLYQGRRRGGGLHDAIGLVLVLLAAPSIGLAPGFPPLHWPALGLAAAAAMTALARLEKDPARAGFARACLAYHDVALLLTAVTAMAVYWTDRGAQGGGAPLTAAYLLVTAALFARRALATESRARLRMALVVAATALPYLGCVDLAGRTLHGNTLALGLAALSAAWLVALRVVARGPDAPALLVRERSGALVLYGAIAAAILLVRFVAEGPVPRLPGPLAEALSVAGPLAMAGLLVAATYWTRSWIPAALWLVILALTGPELRAHVRSWLGLTQSSGTGGAVVMLAVTLLAFRVRGLAALAPERLLGGDPWGSSERFPLRRADHKLFTLPMMLLAFGLGIAGAIGHAAALAGGAGALPSRAAALAIGALAWTLMGVFGRRHIGAGLLVRLGWVALATGLAALLRPLDATRLPLLGCAAVPAFQALEVLYRVAVAPGREWARALLVEPVRRLVGGGSFLLAWVSAIALLWGAPLESMGLLCAILLAECALHAIAYGSYGHGASAFVLLSAIAASLGIGGEGVTALIGIGGALGPLVGLLLAIEVVHVALEAKPAVHERLVALLRPCHAWGALLAMALAIVGGAHEVVAPVPADAPAHAIVGGGLVLLLLLVGRAHASGPFVLAGLALAYELIVGHLAPSATPRASLRALGEPLPLALFTLGLAALGALHRRLAASAPRIVAGAFAIGPMSTPASAWLSGAAAVTGALATVVAASIVLATGAALPSAPATFAAPFVASAALALVAWSSRSVASHHLAAALLAVGNILVARALLLGPTRDMGLSEAHLAVVGLGATLLEGTLLARLARDPLLRTGARRQSLAVALGVIALLVANYAAHTDLAAMSWLRFCVSGALSYLAALYFRRAARNPEPEEEGLVPAFAALHLLGVSMAIWCAALLIPALRRPETALAALAIPAFYFYARAELARGTGPGGAYRDAATALTFALLGLYTFRSVFQIVMFPLAEVSWRSYHHGAPVVLLLAPVMGRLRALGGTPWLAFYGGLAAIAGSFFLVTALPGLSPFEAPDRAALTAAALAHLLLAAFGRRSPLRSLLRSLLGSDESTWSGIAASWGTIAVVGAQVMALTGALSETGRPLLVAPVVAAAASVLVHAAALTKSPLLLGLAISELLLAAHAGLVVESALPGRHAVWAVLAIWACLIALRDRLAEWFSLERTGPASFYLFAIAMAHVVVLHPGSPEALAAVAAMFVLGALTPETPSTLAKGDESVPAALWIASPVWLTYWSQVSTGGAWTASMLAPWPVLCGAAALLAVAFAAERYRAIGAPRAPRWGSPPRVLDRALDLLDANGGALLHAALWVTLGVVLAARHLSAAPLGLRESVLECALLIAASAGFVREGRRAEAALPYFLAEASLATLFVSLREQAQHAWPGAWRFEYDVWAELLAMLGVAAIRELVPATRASRLPVLASLFILPVAALSWTLANGADPDVLLLVLGVHSLIFAFFGREERESPFHAAAILGFVLFAITALHGKLHVRTLHGTVIPAGIGILALVQVFGRRMDARVKANVRLLAVGAMIAASGFYAIAERREWLFQVELLALLIALTVFGALLRVRLYVLMGVLGVAVDLLAIVVGEVTSLERGARMTILGALVLVGGVALVAGAAYYKANEAQVRARLEALRARFLGWE